jgi:HD domain
MGARTSLGGRLRGLTSRQRRAIAFHGLAVIALVPAFAFWAPQSRWDDPVLLLALLAIGVISDLNEVRLPTGIRWDATTVVALVALALAGPLPAIALSLALLLFGELVRSDRKLIRAGNLANLAAYGWDVFVAAQVLMLAGVSEVSAQAAPALFAAGVAMVLTNFMVGPFVYGPAFLNQPATRMLKEFKDTGLIAEKVMSALGAVVTVLTASLGVLALVLFALITVVPQTAFTIVARPRPISALDRLTASKVYAAAIGDMFGFSKDEHRVLACACELSGEGVPVVGDSLSRCSIDEVQEACFLALYARERWDGTGWPAKLPGPAIPLGSRVVAVAKAWSAQTAQGSPELNHEEALLGLAAGSGTQFDPAVVEAARTVVAQEAQFTPLPAFQPRLHGWPGSYAWRRTVAPRVLGRLSGSRNITAPA